MGLNYTRCSQWTGIFYFCCRKINLSISGLVDYERSNIIVVVTKSMSSWYQFDDYESEEEKNTQWNIGANKRIDIILDLQHKVFPKSTTWPVVFIENGGGNKMDAPYSKLPNGQQTHQNLFEAIRDVIAPPGQDTTHDLAGLQVLRLLTGFEPLDLAWQAKTETLLSMPHDTVSIDMLSHIGYVTNPIDPENRNASCCPLSFW